MWFGKFTKVMKEYRYKKPRCYTFFIKHLAIGEATALLGYVDNIIVTSKRV